MKHAILIMAHKNVEQLCRFIGYFQEDCDVFVHFDKKAVFSEGDLEPLWQYSYVRLVSSVYEVNWGGSSVLESELALIGEAFEYGEYDYFHLFSGQDYPLKPLGYFLNFFERNQGKEYLQYVNIPNPKWEHGTYRRFQYFYFFDLAQNKDNPKEWVHEQVMSQIKRGIKRPIPDEFDLLYGSSQWFSVTQKAVRMLLEYTRDSPAFYNRMWMTFAPEECYVATVLLNLLDMKSIVRSNCRFILWRYENGNRPANLGEEHFLSLLESDFLFARKIDMPCSEKLLRLVDRYLAYGSESIPMVSESGAWLYDGYLLYEYSRHFCAQVGRLCAELSVESAVDMGCGPGYYVANWRSHGLDFAGYDANPYTKELSQRILPKDDEACGVVDLTEDLGEVDKFNLVVCKDVLPYIPKEKLDKAIANLARISDSYILVSCSISDSQSRIRHFCHDEQVLIQRFASNGFVLDKNRTREIRISMKHQEYYLFYKKNDYGQN